MVTNFNSGNNELKKFLKMLLDMNARMYNTTSQMGNDFVCAIGFFNLAEIAWLRCIQRYWKLILYQVKMRSLNTIRLQASRIWILALKSKFHMRAHKRNKNVTGRNGR